MEILSGVAQRVEKLEWYHKAMMFPHEPIRNDLRQMFEIITVQNIPLSQSWKIPVFYDWYNKYFYPIVHHHHDAEEDIFFPWIRQRTALPQRLTEDHQDLIKRLDAIKDKRNKFEEQSDEAKWTQAIEELNKDLSELQSHMVEHLDAEEESTTPLLKEHFTEKEYELIVEEIVKSLGDGATIMLPWIIDRISYWGGDEEANAFINSLPLPPRLLYNFSWRRTFEKENRGTLSALRSDSTEDPRSLLNSTSCLLM